MKTFSAILSIALFAVPTLAGETKPSPRETFVAYFKAMDARQEEVAEALQAPECTDQLHMNIHKLNIPARLQPFYELTTADRALVVAEPITILETAGDPEEVIYAELLKQDGQWRIKTLDRISPEAASWLVKGFKMHADVRLDLTIRALAGEWWYPCNSTVVLKEDGTGSNRVVGPGGPISDKPEPLTWAIKGSTLTLRYEDRQELLVITSIDHSEINFVKSDEAGWSHWKRINVAKKKPRGEDAEP